MNKIPNRQAICEVLMKQAETDKDIVVLCSDSRGSASLAPFAKGTSLIFLLLDRKKWAIIFPYKCCTVMQYYNIEKNRT